MSDFICARCGHMIDTPQHELGCERRQELEGAAMDELPEIDAYRAAIGRMCVIACEALRAGHSREAVRVAWLGHGENIHLAALRAQRVTVNRFIAAARGALADKGVVDPEATRFLIGLFRKSRDAVEGEYGFEQGGEWQRRSIPVVGTP